MLLRHSRSPNAVRSLLQPLEATAPSSQECRQILRARCPPTWANWTSPVFDGAQRARANLPFACKGGVCVTCRALLTEGKVTMRRNFALEDAELAAGYVLTCQSLPATDTITLDYDG